MGVKTILKTAFFSKDAFEQQSRRLNIHLGVISFLINVFILVIPTDIKSLQNLHINYVVAFAGFLILNVLMYFIISGIKKKFINFINFFSSVNFFFMISLLVVAVPAFLISHWLVNVVFKNEILGLFLFTLIPYYNFVLFGWLCETVSQEKGKKAIAIALIAITLLFSFYNLLAYITV